MSGQRVFYLHTINGHPAGFCDDQIYYSKIRGWIAPLVPDLKTIRDEQRRSTAFRKSKGWEPMDYGWAKVRLP